MTLPRFAVAQCGCIDEEYQCSRKLRFLHSYPEVLEVHINGIRGITIHITESKIHISYSENHDSTLFFYYFDMSPLPTLANTIAKCITFSISSRFDATKLKKSLDVLSNGNYPFPTSIDTHIHVPHPP